MRTLNCVAVVLSFFLLGCGDSGVIPEGPDAKPASIELTPDEQAVEMELNKPSQG